ncbi:hypothetical protein CJ030_MR0G006138 [Morella rubra]|uniref:BED-type domain-containing protein n=1 Tax=Morella rubra TaxID=262757 RepID=A0A6A1UK35_9ROSI|nr:hypothetical protein CJ030_MR0G006138 [Morella rubra]
MDSISSTPTTNMGSCPGTSGPSNPIDECVSASHSPGDEGPTNQLEEDQPSKKRRNIRKSFVWDHFTKIVPVVRPEHPEAKCHHCKAKVGCHPDHHGTSATKPIDKSQSRLTMDASKAKGNESGMLKLDNYSEKEELAKVKLHLETFTTCSDILLRDIAKRMQKYWAINNFGREKGMDFAAMVRDTLEILFEQYNGGPGGGSITQAAHSSEGQSSISVDEMSIEQRLWGGLDDVEEDGGDDPLSYRLDRVMEKLGMLDEP